jgi:hypothetical protein
MKTLIGVMFILLVTVLAHAAPAIEPRMKCMMAVGDKVAKRHLSNAQKYELYKKEEANCDKTNPAPKKKKHK